MHESTCACVCGAGGRQQACAQTQEGSTAGLRRAVLCVMAYAMLLAPLDTGISRSVAG
jgi:hypothetical protein